MDIAGGGPIAGVVLAAGSGSRLGGRPKGLLELEGVPIVRRVIGAMAGAGVDPIVVVTGHHAAQVEPVLTGLPVRVVRNTRPEDGQTSSQRLGLAALAGRPEDVMVVLADLPLLTAADVTALVQAWRARSPEVALMFPQVEGRRGHPVAFTAAVRDAVLAARPDVGVRQWQAAHSGQARPFPSDNPHYTLDVDTEDDRVRIARETGQVLCWPRSISAGPPDR